MVQCSLPNRTLTRNVIRLIAFHCVEVVLNTNIVATPDGLVCVIENEGQYDSIVGVRVFVMNLVTGLRRKLLPPSIMTSLPTLVRIDTNRTEGRYSIMFLYANLTALEASSWEVYDSMKNIWSKDDMGAMARLKDVEVFNMHHETSYFYENAARFHKKTRAIDVCNLHASSTYPKYTVDRNGHVHNVTKELYKLCKREERHGVWKHMCPNKWEMVCEVSEVEGIWTCLRVMNDWIVLVSKVPHVCKCGGCVSVGTFMKEFTCLQGHGIVSLMQCTSLIGGIHNVDYDDPLFSGDQI